MKQQTWEEELELLIRYYENGVMDYDTLATQKAIVISEHYAELQRQRESIVEEIKKLKRIDKSVGDYEWTKNIGYNDAIDDIIKKVGKHD